MSAHPIVITMGDPAGVVEVGSAVAGRVRPRTTPEPRDLEPRVVGDGDRAAAACRGPGLCQGVGRVVVALLG